MKPFVPIVVFGLAVALVILYVKPARPRIGALRQDITFLEDTLARARELQSVRDRLLTKYNSFTPDDIERVRKLLPDNVDNVRLIIDIDEMAGRYGLAIQEIDIKKERESAARVAGEAGEDTQRDFALSARAAREAAEAEEGLEEPKLSLLTLSFSVRAPYERFIAFLGDLERSLRIVDVTEIEFESDNEATRGHLFKIAVNTYWLQ